MQGFTIEILDGPNYTRDGEGWEHHAYTLRLHYGGSSMDTPWKQGVGITDDPTPADVVEAIASDTAAIVNAESFEDWADEFGYDTDSSAERTYRECVAQAEKFRELVGDDFDAIVFPEDSAAVSEP